MENRSAAIAVESLTSRPPGRVARALAAILVGAVVAPMSVAAHATERGVTVSIYQSEPAASRDENGRPAKLAVDVLEEIATKEGRRLTYVEDSWEHLLLMLADADIDLLISITYMAERAERFRFSEETLFRSWTVLLGRPGTVIASPLDRREDLAEKLRMVLDS